MELDAVTVNVDEPAPVTEAGLKPAAACGGNPASAKFTTPLKLLDAVTVTEKFVVVPGEMAIDAGVADTVKGMKTCTCTCTTELVAVTALLSVATAEKL